jgi:membrane protein DedA with SNARE-associated domain
MTDDAEKFEKFIGLAFPVMVGGRVLGAAVSPLLFAHLPVMLIVMSPFLIHLVAVAPLVGAPVYFPVALVITTMQALVGFHFGNALGARALEWLLERVPFPPSLAERLLELVRRVSVMAIFAVPGPVMGTIAGVAGVKKGTFHLLVAPAQAIWVTAAYFVGEALLEYIEIARTFVIEHAFVLTSISVCFVGLRLLYGRFIKGRAKEYVSRWKEKFG